MVILFGIECSLYCRSSNESKHLPRGFRFGIEFGFCTDCISYGMRNLGCYISHTPNPMLYFALSTWYSFGFLVLEVLSNSSFFELKISKINDLIYKHIY